MRAKPTLDTLAVAILLAAVVSARSESDNIFVRLDHHLNDIDSIHCGTREIVLVGRDGAMVHSRQDSLWSIDLARRSLDSPDTASQYHLRTDQELTRWLYDQRLAINGYPAALMSRARDSALVILTQTSGEDAVWTRNCLIDTLRRKFYCYPLDKTKTFDFDSHALWLGRFNGCARIDRTSGERHDFIVLPTITEESSFLVDGDNLWIAADGIGIQRLNLRTRENTFWTDEDLLRDTHERLQSHNRSYTIPAGQVVFTNFEPVSDQIYVACHYVGGGNYLIRRSSYLLAFNRLIEEWEAGWLQSETGRCEGISLIKKFGHYLVMGGGHQDAWEGAGHEEFGGVFLVRAGDRLSAFEHAHDTGEVKHEHLVTSLKDGEEGDLLIETFTPADQSRKRIYRMNRDYQITVLSDSIGDFWYQYQRQRKLGNPRGMGALHDSLRALLVVPKVRPLRRSQVAITTY